ncbi:CoxG family protein [Pyrofollis japonicus]|uniref:CoxG family protein n=1 Tax=Pyrofollis japonicus TaxID=3060460 RepID=UPI00295B0FDC|nr:SRPBCC domain-containing protein [Pyrofollis japonicus]
MNKHETVLHGEFTVNRDNEYVIAFLTSPKKIAPCLPDLIEWKQHNDTKFQAVFRVDIGGVVEYISRLRSKTVIEIKKKQANEIIYEFRGEIARAPFSGTIRLDVIPLGNNRSKIRWQASINLGKALRLLNKFIDTEKTIQRIVNKVVDSIVRCIEEQ